MAYTKHIEYVKNVIDTHPQTGESKPNTIIDCYFYSDNIHIWGWGTSDRIPLMSEELLDKVFQNDGYIKTWKDGKENCKYYSINYLEGKAV